MYRRREIERRGEREKKGKNKPREAYNPHLPECNHCETRHIIRRRERERKEVIADSFDRKK